MIRIITQRFRHTLLSTARSSFVRNLALLTSGTVAGQAIYMVALPVLGRILTPEDFGEASTIISYANLIAAIACLKYETATVSAESDEDALGLLLLSAMLACAVTGISTVGILGLRHAKLLGLERFDTTSLLITWPTSLAIALYMASRYMTLRFAGYPKINKAILIQNTTRGAGSVSLATVYPHWLSLLISEFLGYLSAASVLGTTLYRKQSGLLRKIVTLRHLSSLAFKYRQYALWLVPSTAIATIATTGLIPLYLHLFGSQQAGHFALAYRAMVMPVGLVALTLGDVFHHRITTYSRRSLTDARRLFIKTSIALFIAFLPLSLVIFFSGPWLFGIIFGKEWLTAGQLASTMAPWGLAQITVSPLSRIVFVTGRQRLKFAYDSIALLALVVTFFLSRGSDSTDIIRATETLTYFNVAAYIIYFILLLRSISPPVIART